MDIKTTVRISVIVGLSAVKLIMFNPHDYLFIRDFNMLRDGISEKAHNYVN
uniref:Uncharacterized protein n=1 Tax=Nelumbo nucifera TaxID=4432 RepID=A0A822Y1G9_NELNU|nr:TPA_asm: hypothetical protein HUJ06_024961 [Nelumbo nucifera]